MLLVFHLVQAEESSGQYYEDMEADEEEMEQQEAEPQAQAEQQAEA